MKSGMMLVPLGLALMIVEHGWSAEPAEAAAVVKGNNTFALELYGKLRSQEGNLFFSPYSISTALAMTCAGARGETANEMAAVLHFPRQQESLHQQQAALIKQLSGDDDKRGYRLSIANALWGQQGYGFRDEFLRLLQDNYGTGLQEVDFLRQTEQARQAINAWTAKRTEQRIKDLLQPGILTTDTRFVLTNAIYFKGNWARPFNKEHTFQGDFQLSAKETVVVPTMVGAGQFNYVNGPDFEALELPYAGKDLSMVVLLPKKVDGLPEFEKSATVDKLAAALSQLKPVDFAEVTLPRFKMTLDFQLEEALGEMGMPGAFIPSEADFSGITGRQGLYLTAVIHKAFVEVNEEGTEAAAATAVVGGEESEPPMFHADHPFLFLIRDTRSGSILFLGRVVNPVK